MITAPMMTPERFRTFAVLAAMTASLGLSVSARAMEITAEQRAACTPDAMRLCSAEIPDIPRVTACMKANRASLSPRCQSAMAAAEHPATVAVAKPAVYVAEKEKQPARATHHVQQRVAETHHASHPRVVADVDYRQSRRQRADYLFGDRQQSEQAFAIAAQIMAGFGQACANHSLPYDVCHVSRHMVTNAAEISPEDIAAAFSY